MSLGAGEAYLNARVSVMTARLLAPAQLDALVEEPIERVVRLARGLGIVGALEGQAGGVPKGMGRSLLRALLEDFTVLTRPLRYQMRDLFVYWLARFELRNLKAVVRGRMNGLPEKTIRDQLLDLGHFARVSPDDLLRTEDVPELLRLLERTRYADIAREARHILDEHHETFLLDATIDQQYFAGLARRAAALPAGQVAPVRRLIGTIIDHYNLLWLLRYRFAYGLPPAKTYYLLAPGGLRLTSARLLRLVEGRRTEDVLGALPAPLSGALDGAHDVPEVERRMDRELRRGAARVLADMSSAPARGLAFLVLREMDMRRVLALVKGRRLNLDAGLIRYAMGLTEE